MARRRGGRVTAVRVVVYKNLNKGCWSIAEATRTGGRGRVLEHVQTIALREVSFHVKEARRRVVVSERCREVHAWASGILCDPPPPGPRLEVTYNPYRAPTFTTRDGAPVHAAPLVLFTDRAWVCQEST